MIARGEAEGTRARVLGAVLCGGASRRMGRDKALLRLAGGDAPTLLARAAGVLAEVTGDVVLACGLVHGGPPPISGAGADHT